MLDQQLDLVDASRVVRGCRPWIAGGLWRQLVEVLVVLERSSEAVLLKLDQELQVEKLCGYDCPRRSFRRPIVQADVIEQVKVAADDGLEAQQAEPDLFDKRAKPLNLGRFAY